MSETQSYYTSSDDETWCNSIDKNEQVSAIIIQRFVRGFIVRNNYLPFVLYTIKNTIISNVEELETKHTDGRINSCFDEQQIIHILYFNLNQRISVPQKDRMWFDILGFDYKVGWIPINIKSTTMTTPDNVGNLSVCVQPLTEYRLSFDEMYTNGYLTDILTNYLHQKKINTTKRKDYYFLVINKNNPKDIIINSVLGLKDIRKNLNNLPFQVKWNNNKVYSPRPIKNVIKDIVLCLYNEKLTWKQKLMSQMYKLKLQIANS